ncbi:uncharacterized protein LOC116188798 [Punica granatum]|uniref:Uncharacterized protein LOC116188798 n=2 Tax=Punica granatum TaxID=22663 RepID=A0A6P8BY40_PUNGR|nr:uncharacterized protein LOC116188798 [Punica granatum]
MARSVSFPHLDRVTPPLEEINHIWAHLHQVNRNYISTFVGDIPMLAMCRVDWNFLGAAVTFWDPVHAVFNIQENDDFTDSPPVESSASSGAPVPDMTIQAELANLRAERDRLRREIAEKNEQLSDRHQLQKELAQTRAQLQKRDQELAQANAALERVKKRACVGGQPSSAADDRARIAVLESMEQRLKKLEENIRALQSGGSRLDAGDGDWSLFPGMQLPPKIKVPEFQSLAGAALDWYMSLKTADIPTWADLSSKFIDQYRYRAETPPTLLELSTMEMTGAYYLHLLAHTSSFSNLIDAGKKLDIGIKLGKIEGPAEKKEGESSKRAATGTTGNRRGKDTSVNAVNSGHQAPQQYSISYTPAPPATQAYAPPSVHYQQQPPTQQAYYSAPPASFPSSVPQQYAHNYAPAPPPIQQSKPLASRTPQPVQRAPVPQDQQGIATQTRRKQFTPLPAPLSHIYRQLLAGNKIRSIAPNPDFDPTIQDQSRRCEYHQGAPGHTIDNCWKLRERIQQMIDDKQLTFNAVKPPNVQSNLLPNHGSSSGPSINMIGICAIGEYETGQEEPAPFVIEYVPAETGVGYAGFDATPAPFVIEVPAREPYQDSKVPWTYEGSVGNLEHQFSVMSVTRSGRVYENPKATNKGKALAMPEVAPEASSIPQKKVTKEKAEAFMKIIKASEYKVVEQMAKSPAHISLLALLLGSEPHREALLRVLTAAQIPKETAPERIEETISSIFSNNISFSDDELPSEGWAHSRALHIMNVDFNRIRSSKTAVRAFDGSRREVNGEIDLVIEVGPCSFAVTFQVLDIPNAFSLLLGRPWIHAASAVPSSLHQMIKFIAEDRFITVKGEEDYAIYKETAVPYITIEWDEECQKAFDTIKTYLAQPPVLVPPTPDRPLILYLTVHRQSL